jgi:hypothetical protein
LENSINVAGVLGVLQNQFESGNGLVLEDNFATLDQNETLTAKNDVLF